MNHSGSAIYLDNAATTRVLPAVAEVMLACLREDFGNPSSAHGAGRRAAARIATARAQLLAALGGGGFVVFTSGGTEADALGVWGGGKGGVHAVVTAVEHPAVLEAARRLARVTVVPVSERGVVDPDAVARAVKDDTAVVACMLVQNELGTIQPVADVVRAVRARRPGVHVHCDAVQALGKIPVDAIALGVDSLAVSAHKLHGPKGTGALWLAPDARVRPIVAGGGQERGLRGGTENVAGIAAFGAAAELACQRIADGARIAELRDRLVACVGGALLLGDGAARVPHIATLAFRGKAGAPLVESLEAAGVLVSAGAACHGSARSHVLDAIGAPADAGVVRVSLSSETTADEIAACGRALATIVRPWM